MFKITKKRTILALIALAIVGSLVTFHATNLVLASILNKDCPFNEFVVTLFPSLTFLFVALDFILFMFLFYRLYLHPTHEQRIYLVYGSTLVAFSGVALITNTLSGVLTYGNFLVAHPFIGFHIFMYIFHALMMALGFLMIFLFRKKVINDDILIHKTTAKYVFQTILLALIVFITLNRLGAFILTPTFVQWSSLGLTYPAYVALILPTIIIVIDAAYVFGGFKKSPKAGIVACAFVLFFSIFCCIQICYRGMSDQLFIQLISPINPIGRLLTFPYDAVLQMIVAAGLAIYTLVDSIRFKRATDFNKLPYELRMAKLQGRQANFLKPAEEKKTIRSRIKARFTRKKTNNSKAKRRK